MNLTITVIARSPRRSNLAWGCGWYRHARSSSNPKSKIKNPKSFTLIELLVVVAIIAVLVSLLLPALGSARDRARSLVCGSNLRQIGVAFYQYAHDHAGRFPPLNAVGNSANWQWWTNLLVGGNYLAGEFDSPAYGDIAPGSRIWNCPDAKDYWWCAGYGANEGHVIRYVLSVSLEELADPGKVFVVGDARESGGATWPAAPCPICRTWGTPYCGQLAPRHRGRVNLAFADGHAQEQELVSVLADAMTVFNHPSP